MKKRLLSLVLSFGCVAIIAVLFGFKQETLRRQLVGQWRNVYLKMRMNIYDKTSQPTVMEVDSTNWETRLQIKPISTNFKDDGTYRSEYRNLKDSVVRVTSGTWNITGDSLTMLQTKPDASTLKVHLSIKGDHATFAGMIDFNGDSKKDDDYFGIQKKYSSKP